MDARRIWTRGGVQSGLSAVADSCQEHTALRSVTLCYTLGEDRLMAMLAQSKSLVVVLFETPSPIISPPL